MCLEKRESKVRFTSIAGAVTYLSLKSRETSNPEDLSSSWLLIVHRIITRVITA